MLLPLVNSSQHLLVAGYLIQYFLKIKKINWNFINMKILLCTQQISRHVELIIDILYNNEEVFDMKLIGY